MMPRIAHCDPVRTGIIRIMRWRISGQRIGWVVVAAFGVGAFTCLEAGDALSQSSPEPVGVTLQGQTFTDAQSLFYNARYEEAAQLTLALRSLATHDLASDELRTSALLFQLKALLESRDGKNDKEKTLRECASCPTLMAAFLDDLRHGQNLARAALRVNAKDEEALFYLGKLNLNYVWLQLGPLGRKTGWDEYWEARRSLDAVLKENPQHVRARVARAWIDYIVDTRMPWGTRWLLGGGSKKRALSAVREAALVESEFFAHAEAEFALWDMHVRERDMARATEVAQRLARDFPENLEVARFLEVSEARSRQ